jgi:hypothetical protein
MFDTELVLAWPAVQTQGIRLSESGHYESERKVMKCGPGKEDPITLLIKEMVAC